MILTRKHIVVILLAFRFALVSYSQETVKVVTRKVEHSWETKDGCQVFIAADKARIHIEQSVGNTLKVELKLIAKHSNGDIAKKEVQYLKYNLTKKGNDYYLNNNILLPKNTASAESRLTAIYTIKAPKECHINITNMLGNTTLKGLSNQVEISVNYGNIYVNNCTGKLNVKTKVGDIDIKNSSLDLTLQTEYSEISMEEISGSVDIASRFGNINLEPGKHLKQLKIDAHKTDVYIFNTDFIEYDMDINSEHGSIKANKECYFKSSSLLMETKSKGETTKLSYPLKTSAGAIKINCRFSTVNLR